MQAIILAGGLGTRLRGVVPDLPKPMAPVAGRPFLAWVLDELVAARFERVVLAVGYRHAAIRDHFGRGYRGLRLSYSVEEHPLGTGGAIRLAAEGLGPAPFFVLNGDTFVEIDHSAMLAAHAAAVEQMSMAVCRVPDAGRYGALEVDCHHVRGFREKGQSGPGIVNAGVYLLPRTVLQHIPCGHAFSFEQDLLVPRVQALQPAAFETRGLFIDIGVPEDYARAQQLFARRSAAR